MINTIKNLAKLELVVIALTVIALFLTESYLPVELQEYLAQDAEAIPTTIGLVMLIIVEIVAIFNLVSIFGLIGHKMWARKMFIYTTILIFPLCVFIGPQVDHAVSYTLDQISVLIQGMILSLLVFNSSYQDSALNNNSQGDAKSARLL